MVSKHKETKIHLLSISFYKKVLIFLILHISRSIFIPPQLRPFLLKICGIRFSKSKSVFIGQNVLFDNIEDTYTSIGENVVITTGTKIINHYPIFSNKGVKEYERGNVIIEDNVFIGMNTLIVKSVRIGKGAVIAAGSVVIKDVPENVVVGGNPAKILSEINY